MARILGMGIAAALLLAAHPIHAQTPVATEKYAISEGFNFDTDAPPRVLVFRPELKVGEQTTAGIFQNNAAWHAAALRELNAALITAGIKRGLDLELHDEKGGNSASLAEHRALFRIIVGTIIRHKLFGKDPLPSKQNRFDWSLGSGVAQIDPAARADYGLFLLSHDVFESAGRRTARLVASLMGNDGAAGAHFGYAALVDMKSGDIVWLGVDLKASGDVRTAEGAAQRVEQLLKGFPVRNSDGAVNK